MTFAEVSNIKIGDRLKTTLNLEEVGDRKRVGTVNKIRSHTRGLRMELIIDDSNNNWIIYVNKRTCEYIQTLDWDNEYNA